MIDLVSDKLLPVVLLLLGLSLLRWDVGSRPDDEQIFFVYKVMDLLKTPDSLITEVLEYAVI